MPKKGILKGVSFGDGLSNASPDILLSHSNTNDVDIRSSGQVKRPKNYSLWG